MDNMRIWNQVEKTNPNYTRDVNLGRKFTAIDANYQVMKATEVFGPFGIGWGVKNSKFDLLIADHTDPHYNLLQYTAVLWFKDGNDYGEFDINSDIELFEEVNDRISGGKKWKRVEDSHKKVSTDAMTKGLSRLGFSADVFLKKFDDNRYVQSLRNEFKSNDTSAQYYTPEPTKKGYTPKPKQEESPAPAPVQENPATQEQRDRIQSLCQEKGMDGPAFQAKLKEWGFKWKTLTAQQAYDVMSALDLLK